MGKLLHKFFAVMLILITLTLVSCDSSDSSNSYKLYCDNCKEKVAVKLEFYGYKYHNEYGSQVKLWDAYCTKCSKHLGVYSGAI